MVWPDTLPKLSAPSILFPNHIKKRRGQGSGVSVKEHGSKHILSANLKLLLPNLT